MIESYNNPDQITSPDKFEEDVLVEQSLRPNSFDDFVGQQETVENLKVYIEAALQRDEALDHVLLFGPPGLGKTTLAGIIAKEMKVNIKIDDIDEFSIEEGLVYDETFSLTYFNHMCVFHKLTDNMLMNFEKERHT